MDNIQWISWGGYEARGTATVFRQQLRLRQKRTVQANVTFSFPVEWDSHLVYATYTAFPTTQNKALFDEDMKYSIGNGLAL